VYVTRGALAHMTNEAEFAAVMGHEMSHYTARHSAKQLTHQQLMSLGLGIGAAFLPEEESLTSTLIAGAGVLAVQLAQLHYSRSQEEQADRVGTYYMYRAGYDPRRMLDMQRLLQRVAGGGESSFLAEYFSTHPSAETRLSRIEGVIREYDLGDGKALQGDGTFADRWQRRLAPLRPAQKAYDVFDRANALAAKQQFAEALQLCRQAQSMARDQAPFYRLEGDLLRAMKRPGDALAPYRRAVQIDRRYLPAVRGLAAADLSLDKLPDAEAGFRDAVRLLPADLDSHFGLGLATYGQGKFAEAAGSFETVVGSVAYPPALTYLGLTYEKLDRRDQAIQAYRACVEAGTGEWKDSEAVKRASERLDQLGAAATPSPATSP
jgi:predicted Zn-dependent protease